MTKQKRKGKGVFAAIGIIALMLLIIGVITTITSAAPPNRPHTIYGFVFDPDKKPVSEEQVVLINSNTGDSLQTRTASDGSYTFELANLPKGYKNGDRLEVQARAQEKSILVETSVGQQRVDDIILDERESPQSKPEPSPPTSAPTLGDGGGGGAGTGAGGGQLTVVSPTPTTSPTPTPTPKKVPGFEAVFAIAGLFAVAYLVPRTRRKKKK